MQLNKILAVLIVLIFLLAFIIWFVLVGIALFTDPSELLSVTLPGAVVFGFWFLIAYRLYKCPPGI